MTAFPCYGCDDCGAAATEGDPHPADQRHNHIDTLYRQNESSCFRYIACNDNAAGSGNDDFVHRGDRSYAPQCPYGGDCPPKNPSYHVTGMEKLFALPPFFQPTFPNRTNVCRLSMAYAEGSTWAAAECVDRVYAGGPHFQIDWEEYAGASLELTFGCQSLVTGLFQTQLADGIMGMMNTPASYWHQLYEAQKIDQRQFSLCFTSAEHVYYEGSEAGAMVLGGSDTRLHQTPMVFAAFAKKGRTEMFYVVVEQIYLRMNGGGSIVERQIGDKEILMKAALGRKSKHSLTALVDSGSTNSYISSEYEKAFTVVWKEMTGLDYDATKQYTFENSSDLSAILPTIVIQFKPWGNEDRPALVAFPPLRYMRYVPSKDIYQIKLGFRESTDVPIHLGANVMTGHDVLFDVDNERLGFAESNCDFLSLGYERFNVTSSLMKAEQAYNAKEAQISQDSQSSGSYILEKVTIAIIGLLIAVVIWWSRKGIRARNEVFNSDEYERVASADTQYDDGTEMTTTGLAYNSS